MSGITLVEEVDGFHAGILLVADLQLVELAEQIDQPLHHLHTLLTEPGTHRENRQNTHRDSDKHTDSDTHTHTHTHSLTHTKTVTNTHSLTHTQPQGCWPLADL